MIQRRDIEGVQSESGPWESEGWEMRGAGKLGVLLLFHHVHRP